MPIPRLTTVCALAAVSAASLQAGEIFASVGWRKTYDDEGAIGTGAAGRFGAGWRWSKKAGIETDFGFSRNRREIGVDGLFAGRTKDLTVSVIRHFGGGRVEPYILGGAGAVHYTNLDRGRPPGPNSEFGYQLHFAFGLKGWLSDRFYLRPEVRISAGDGSALRRVVEPGLFGATVSFGAGYRW